MSYFAWGWDAAKRGEPCSPPVGISAWQQEWWVAGWFRQKNRHQFVNRGRYEKADSGGKP